MTIYSRDPAYFGTATFGHSRFGTYTSRWEQTLAKLGVYRNLIWRRIKYINTPDSTTGYINPSYDEITIQGILFEKGSSASSSGFGVFVKQDATLITPEPVGRRGSQDETFPDQVKDESVVYEVDSVEKNLDPIRGGAAFYTVNLHKLELFTED